MNIENETQTTTKRAKAATYSPRLSRLNTRYQVIDIGSGIVFDDSSPIQSTNNSIDTSFKSAHINSGSSSERRSIKGIGDIVLTKTLGAGSTGKVKLGINQRTGQKLAVKIVYRDLGSEQRKSKESREARERRIMREASLLNLIKHPHIVQLYDMLVTDDFYCLFFECVEGGQMLDYIISHGRLKENLARRFFRQLLSAVDYCHRNSIVHRDLKIENVLIDKDGNIKLIDFGLSNFFNPKDSLRTFCGSLYFAAPELLKGNVYVGPEVDVWSLGVIFYVLVCGKVPFDDKSLPMLHEKIKKCSFEIPDDLSSECRHLLSRMIVGDPSQRASLAEVMHHPWTLGSIVDPSNLMQDIPGGDICNYLPERPPLSVADPGILESVCLEFGIDISYANATINAAIKDWHAFNKHEIVSLYYLTLEKIQREALPSETQPNFTHPKFPRPRSSSLSNLSSSNLNDISINRRNSLPNSTEAQEIDLSSQFKHLDCIKIKSVYLKGIFSVHTTTLKTPSVLASGIARILSLNSIKFSLSDATFHCNYIPSIDFSSHLRSHVKGVKIATDVAIASSNNAMIIIFEINIVRVALLGLLGIHFHRIQGDFKQYKNLCSHILAELHI